GGSDRPALTVDLVAGPAAGRWTPVRAPGRYAIGRAHDAAIPIADRSVSRRHATIELPREGRPIVHPGRCATNGVLVNGVEVDGPTAVAPTDLVALGATRLVVRPLPAATEATPAGDGPLGRIDFHRTPYRPARVADVDVAPIGPIPEPPE